MYSEISDLEKTCLKDALIRTIKANGQGKMESNYLVRGAKAYTYQDILQEVKNESEVGKAFMVNIIALSIHLLTKEAKQKEVINE